MMHSESKRLFGLSKQRSNSPGIHLSLGKISEELKFRVSTRAILQVLQHQFLASHQTRICYDQQGQIANSGLELCCLQSQSWVTKADRTVSILFRYFVFQSSHGTQLIACDSLYNLVQLATQESQEQAFQHLAAQLFDLQSARDYLHPLSYHYFNSPKVVNAYYKLKYLSEHDNQNLERLNPQSYQEARLVFLKSLGALLQEIEQGLQALKCEFEQERKRLKADLERYQNWLWGPVRYRYETHETPFWHKLRGWLRGKAEPLLSREEVARICWHQAHYRQYCIQKKHPTNPPILNKLSVFSRKTLSHF